MYLLEIGDCQKAMGRWAEAAVTYRRYLALPQAKNRAAVRKSLAEVERHLGGQSTGGGALAIAPLVASPASSPMSNNPLDAAPLVATPLAAPPPPPTLAPPVPMAAVGDNPEVQGEVSSNGEGGHSRAWAYTLLGVAVAAAAVAVVGWVDVAGYNGYVSSVTSGQVVSSGLTARQNLSSAQTWQIVAISTTIATGLAAGGVALTW
jgi:hypothetical protein